jgi:glutaredoxin
MAKTELFGTAGCAYTQEMRDWLELRRIDFVEYDVELDAAARQRLRELAEGQRTVPVLVEDGVVTRIGWNGHGCAVGA